MAADALQVQHWTALLVDDVQAMRSLMRELLRNLGIAHFKEAQDGTRALEILQTNAVNIVITDLVMAPMDGVEMTRHIRRPNNHQAFVPILMVSGHRDEVSIKRALDAGVTDFLIKPLTAAALSARIKSTITHPRPKVKTANYWGPDRRRRAIWVRQERRSMAEWA